MKDLDVARQRDQKACPASCLWTTVFFHPSARVFFVHRRCYKRSTSTKKDGLIQSSVAGRQRRRKPQQSTIHRGLVFLLSIGTVIISLMFYVLSTFPRVCYPTVPNVRFENYTYDNVELGLPSFRDHIWHNQRHTCIGIAAKRPQRNSAFFSITAIDLRNTVLQGDNNIIPKRPSHEL